MTRRHGQETPAGRRGWIIAGLLAAFVLALGIRALRFDGAFPDDGSVQFALTGSNYTPGEWHHLAVVYDGNENTADNVKLYWTPIDGYNGTASLAKTGRLWRRDLARIHIHLRQNRRAMPTPL